MVNSDPKELNSLSCPLYSTLAFFFVFSPSNGLTQKSVSLCFFILRYLLALSSVESDLRLVGLWRRFDGGDGHREALVWVMEAI